MKRRNFLKNSLATGVGLITISGTLSSFTKKSTQKSTLISTPIRPLVIATWDTPLAVETAAKILEKGGSALDAVEQGCRIEEANEKGQSVGKGGLPDRDGNVTLDACIMDSTGNYGATVRSWTR